MDLSPATRILRTLTGLSAIVLLIAHSASAQDSQRRPSLAVLRLKSVQETSERLVVVKDLSRTLAAALRQDKSVDVSDDAMVRAAAAEEGVKPDGLLNPENCLGVGKRLSVDYVVVGAAMLERQKWHASVRILDVRANTMIATAEAEYPQSEMNTLYDVLASRISAAIAHPAKSDTPHTGYSWKKEYLVSFGKYRIDLDPPLLLALNADPPFELSIVADMGHTGTSYAVTNFELFVDDQSLGTIHPQLHPPIPVNECTRTIGGGEYRFSLELKNIRVFPTNSIGEEPRFITSASISVSARFLRAVE